MTVKNRIATAAVFGYACLAFPGSRHFFESSMVLHQAVQLPLLVLCGYGFGRAFELRASGYLEPVDPRGISGLLCLVFTSLFWMIPRYLDASIHVMHWEFVKFVSLPLFAGVPLALSWPRVHPILRALVKVEFFVMLLRLAWLYIDAPERLCNNYLLSEQYTLAKFLFAAAAVWAVFEVVRIFFGEHGTSARSRVSASATVLR